MGVNSHKLHAFLALTYDKLFYKNMKESLKKKQVYKEEGSKEILSPTMERIEKEAIFFNDDEYIAHESKVKAFNF